METTYKCLIVDDEQPAHFVIKNHLEKLDDLEYAGSAYNGKEAIKMLAENEYHILFLDIEMPLVNGIELLQTAGKRPATIITTAYDNFAFEAFQNDAVDYLRKPISLSRFIKAIQKAKVFQDAQTPKQAPITSILLKISGEKKSYLVTNIVCLQSIGNYVKVYFAQNNKSITVYDSLKNMLDILPENIFVQSHKSYVINKHFIKTLNKEAIVLHNGMCVPLGRKYELLVVKSIAKQEL